MALRIMNNTNIHYFEICIIQLIETGDLEILIIIIIHTISIALFIVLKPHNT